MPPHAAITQLKYLTLKRDLDLDHNPDHDWDFKCDCDISSRLGDMGPIWLCRDLDFDPTTFKKSNPLIFGLTYMNINNQSGVIPSVGF